MNTVRILPMDKEEHCNQTIEYIQEKFFLEDLPRRYDSYGSAKYCYKKNGILAKEDTPILFQYKNKIIAMALFKERIKFDEAQDGYFGTYYFNPETIKVFNPISESDICKIFNKTIIFSQTKHKLDKNFFPDFIATLENLKEVDKSIIKTKEWGCYKTICTNSNKNL